MSHFLPSFLRAFSTLKGGGLGHEESLEFGFRSWSFMTRFFSFLAVRLWASASTSLGLSHFIRECFSAPLPGLLQRSPPIMDVNMSCKLLVSLQTQALPSWYSKANGTSVAWSRLFAKYAHLMGFYKYTHPLLITISLIISLQILSLHSLCFSPLSFLFNISSLSEQFITEHWGGIWGDSSLGKHTNTYFVRRRKQNEARTPRF